MTRYVLLAIAALGTEGFTKSVVEVNEANGTITIPANTGRMEVSITPLTQDEARELRKKEARGEPLSLGTKEPAPKDSEGGNQTVEPPPVPQHNQSGSAQGPAS